jgi:hypothetical protein
MKSARIFQGRLRAQKGCFANGDDDDNNNNNNNNSILCQKICIEHLEDLGAKGRIILKFILKNT